MDFCFYEEKTYNYVKTIMSLVNINKQNGSIWKANLFHFFFFYQWHTVVLPQKLSHSDNVIISNIDIDGLTLKHRETHGCVVSTVATDALVLKHQAISILSTD